MITLTIILCTLNGECRTERKPVEPPEGSNPGFACMMYGQLEALKEAEKRPGYYVRKWVCGSSRYSDV